MVLNWKWMIYECVFRMGSIKQHMCAKLCTMPSSPTAIWLVRALKTPTAEQDVQRLHGQCFTVQWLELWDLGVWYSRSRSHERYPAETLPDISGWGIQGGWGPTIYDMHNAHALRYCYWWSSFFDHVSQVEASPQHAMQVTKNLVENMQQSPATSLHLHGFYIWRILAYLGPAWFQIFDQQPCDCVFKCFVGSVYIYIYYIERFPIYPCIPPSRRHTHTHTSLCHWIPGDQTSCGHREERACIAQESFEDTGSCVWELVYDGWCMKNHMVHPHSERVCVHANIAGKGINLNMSPNWGPKGFDLSWACCPECILSANRSWGVPALYEINKWLKGSSVFCSLTLPISNQT